MVGHSERTSTPPNLPPTGAGSACSTGWPLNHRSRTSPPTDAAKPTSAMMAMSGTSNTTISTTTTHSSSGKLSVNNSPAKTRKRGGLLRPPRYLPQRRPLNDGATVTARVLGDPRRRLRTARPRPQRPLHARLRQRPECAGVWRRSSAGGPLWLRS